MKRIILGITLITILVTITAFTGCVRVDMSTKNGPIEVRNYDYTGFTGLDVGSALKLEVACGDSYNVTITAGQNLFDHVRVSLSGSTLKIDLTGWSFAWWSGSSIPRVNVTMPVLTYLHLSGAADGDVSGFDSSEKMDVELSGASHLDIDMAAGPFKAILSGASTLKGKLTVTASDIDISGASDIDLTGSGGDIKIHASGASSVALVYYLVDNADVNFSGATDGYINVSGILNVTLTGASDLKYTGNPTLGTVNTSGASDLIKKSQP